MTTLTHLHFIAAIAVVMGFGAAACGGPAASTPGPKASVPAPVELAPAPHCKRSTRVAVLVDKTMSIAEYAIEQPTLADFHSLIAALRRCGGEIAVGSVRDAVGDPLVQLDVPREILPPSCAQTVAPDRAPRNPLIRASLIDECRKRQRAFEPAAAAYEDDLAARTERFEREVGTILDEPATYRRTELWLAIAQANTFLNELRQPPPDTALILVSDARHTTRTRPVELTAAMVFVVNGLGHAGDLGDAPARFSRLRAAFEAAVPHAAIH